MEAMFTIAPTPWARMRGATSRLIRTAGIRFRSIARCHSSALVSWKDVPVEPPTLLIRTSIRPNAASAASTTSRAPASVVTSATTAIASAPSARASAAAASRASFSRAQRATRQPSRASSSAMARPIPRLEPVTSAAFPLSPRSITILLHARRRARTLASDPEVVQGQS